MPSVIHLLPDHVANQIAAGEVVQRPASVVKELLENAVDAKATDIKLIVKDGGKTLIQVIDNGVGMNVTDARMCFERHATSKIKNAEDLFNLHTKGFRGEALASIAAVAHVELKTKPKEQDLGTHLIIEGSKIAQQEVAVLPTGSSFTVKNLFFNIPARRNFLKSDSLEFRHISDEFLRVALAHHSINFTLINNGSEQYNLPASNLRQRIVGVLGSKSNEKLIPVQEHTEILSVNGFVLKPEFAKKGKTEQFFFVNNRYIRSGYLHHAVMNAFEGLLKESFQPGYFLYLEVPTHTVDINIHPTKTEVKFDDEQALYAILRASIKHSLGQFNIAPILDFERDANLDVPYNYFGKKTESPAIAVDDSFNPFKSKLEKNKEKFKKPTEHLPHWESLYVGLKQDTAVAQNISFESEEITSSLFDDASHTETKNTFQLNKKFIVSTLKSGLIIIHQSRAHQRILYEKFLSNLTVKKGLSQQLLFSISISFSKSELSILKDIEQLLTLTGFSFEEFRENEIVINGLPVYLSENKIEEVLHQIIYTYQNELPENSFSETDILAKTLSKAMAIKSGTLLSVSEQEQIINELFACKETQISPFLKPIFTTLSTEELDKKLNL